jgi:acyl-coenzyme A thioesterase PaaI-like protein
MKTVLLLKRALNVVSKQVIADFLAREFPQSKCVVESVGDQASIISHPIGFDELRPGGTVSGPVLMTVADVALYVAVLGELGLVALAVTSNLSINFLRKPAADKDIVGHCKLVKVGRTLVMGEVMLYSRGDDKPVAQVMGTYALPAQT